MSKGNQSDFMSSAEQMKQDLGPALCLAKWKQVSFHLPTGLNNSCYHPPLHQISVEDLKRTGGLHNTDYKKLQRKLMLSGQRPSECQYCWNVEDSSNSFSDRIFKSAEPWSEPYFEEIKVNLLIYFYLIVRLSCI